MCVCVCVCVWNYETDLQTVSRRRFLAGSYNTIQKPRDSKCSHLWILTKLHVVFWVGGGWGDTSSKLIFIFTSTVESGVEYSSEKWVFTDKTIRCEGPEDRNMNLIASKQDCIFPSPTPVAIVIAASGGKSEKGGNQNQYLTNGTGMDMWLLVDNVTLRVWYIKIAVNELINTKTGTSRDVCEFTCYTTSNSSQD